MKISSKGYLPAYKKSEAIGLRSFCLLLFLPESRKIFFVYSLLFHTECSEKGKYPVHFYKTRHKI